MPKSLAYREFYDDGDEIRTDAADLNDGEYDRAAVTAITAAGVLSIDAANIVGNHELFSSTALPSAPSQTFTYADDTPRLRNE